MTVETTSRLGCRVPIEDVYLTVLVARVIFRLVSEPTYKLDELARAAGTSPRTVRYYVQRGLLPAPAFRGKDTAYGREHLVRLKAIRRMQDAFLPLDAIAIELERRSIAELERLAEGDDVIVAKPPEKPPPTGTPPLPTTGGGESAPSLRTALGQRAVRSIRRIEVAEGVSLEIADDAPEASLRLAAAVLESFRPNDNEGAER